MHETRARIVTATNELFRRKGYNATSLSDVSAGAGAPTGSIYHFFPGGKRALGEAVIVESADGYRQLFELIADEAGDIASAITAFFDGAAVVLEETDFIDICPIGTVAREVASTDDDLRRASAAAFDSWIRAATTRFRDAGIGDVEAAALAATLVATLEGTFVLARTLRDTTVLHTAGAHVRTLVEAALPARPTARRRPAAGRRR